VAVVALLVRLDVTVTAVRGARGGGARVVAALRLGRARLAATGSITEEQTVELAVVARLARFLDAVAAHGLRANRSLASPAGLDHARARAAVAAHAVAVVALLAAHHHAVAAQRHAFLTRDAALPAVFELAVRVAAV